jgi:hypothetical protein
MTKTGLLFAPRRYPPWRAEARLRRLPRGTKSILDFVFIMSIGD